MARTPKQLRDDLTELVRGDVLLDETDRMLYATDASLFRLKPLGIVVPCDEADLQALVVYAAEQQLSLTPRGGGTGLAGESLTSGLMVDLSRYFNRILAIEDDQVRVQCGVVAGQLNAALKPLGRQLAIDSAGEATCTIGGMIATNASGARILRYGYLRQYVQSLRAVLSSGQAATLQTTEIPPSHPPPSPLIKGGNGGGAAELQLARQLHQLLNRHQTLIASCQPKTPFNRCGYQLHDVCRHNSIDLHKILVGSEGTLGFVTEAVIKTEPLAATRASALVGFASLRETACAVATLLPSQPAVIDLLDRRLLTVAGELDPSFKRQLNPQIQSALLLEWEGPSAEEVLVRAQQALSCLRASHHLLSERLAVGAEAERLWSLRSQALPALLAAKYPASPIPFVEDIGVPVESLADFLEAVQVLLHKHSTSATILSHAGAGIVHLRPLFNLHEAHERDRLKAFAEDIYAEVWKFGGTISAQHGVGLARTGWMTQQYGPLLDVFRDVKRLFDPTGLLNPGKIVGNCGDPFQQLRIPLEPAGTHGMVATTQNGSVTKNSFSLSLPIVEWQLNWSGNAPNRVAEQCNGCGNCRTREPGRRMCPIFRAESSENATPRAKANLMRELLLEEKPAERFRTAEVREIAHLCVNCKMCGVECPSHVEIPKLMLEAKAQHVAENGLDWVDWVFSRMDNWAKWGSPMSWFANPMLRSEWLRWLLDKGFGITQRRQFPAFAADSFLKRARRFGWTKPSKVTDRPRVVYFADTFANYIDPDVAEATVRVLHVAGVEVYVPPEKLVSGAATIAVGHTDRAKRIAQRNINTLADLTRDGYTVLCSEPTAAVMLRQDYLHLLDDPGVEQVARNTVELMWYLQELQRQGRLPGNRGQGSADRGQSPSPLSGKIGHHVPCHVKALQQGVPGPDLLKNLANLNVETLDVSCSGMAGVFGLQAANYAKSLVAGKPMLDRFAQNEFRYGSSECSTCRMQLEHVGKKPVLHPVQYLAWSMGLMPRLGRRLGL